MFRRERLHLRIKRAQGAKRLVHHKNDVPPRLERQKLLVFERSQELEDS